MLPTSPTPSPSTSQRSFFNQAHSTQSSQPSRLIATNPNEIADLFNTYFASVFTTENLPVQYPNKSYDPVLTDLSLSELEVEILLTS